MKILIVTDAWHPQLNGVVRTYDHMISELEALGHIVKVIGPHDFPLTCPMPGYTEIRLALFPYNHLRATIEEFSPELLHIATEGPLGLAARKYAVRNGMAFTSCYHTHFPDYAASRAAEFLPFLYNPVRALAIRYVRFFHAPSSCVFVATRSLENTLKSWNFTAPIKHMTRGVDTAMFSPGEKTLFHDIPKPVALFVGRLAIEKNAEAFLSMSWEGSKVIVGDGPDREALRARFPHAHFIGVQKGEDLAACYRSADIFVFPSKTDTFGMVLVESLACGLPVASYPVTGPIDIITENFLGVLDDDLSMAARRALDCGTAEERIAWVRAHYSWRMATDQFLDFG